jgi:hypothetical protein
MSNKHVLTDLEEKRKSRQRADYYASKVDRLTCLGYNNPAKDTDLRQRKIWEYIIEHDLTVAIHPEYDFKSNLAGHDSPRYEKTQTRENCEDDDRVEWLYNEIYTRSQRQKRVVMGWTFDDDGKMYPSSGNKRSRCHVMGQIRGNLSKSIGAFLEIGGELTDAQKEWHAFHISELSNHDDGEAPEPESGADIVSQLAVAHDLYVQNGIIDADMSPEKNVEWASQWILEHKPTYIGDNMKSTRTDMAKKAFSPDRSDPIPLPDNNRINHQWLGFFPGEAFDPTNQEVDVQMLTIKGHHKQTWRLRVTDRWFAREEFTHAREDYWLVVRCGEGQKDVTSLSSLEKMRETCLAAMTAWNKSENYKKAGMPRIERVMFVKQLKGSTDKYIAYQWSKINEEFRAI